MDGIRALIETLKRDKARRRRLAGIFCVLAMFVAGGVFWRLRIIGLTKAVDPLCGVPEHIHTEDCIVERILICGHSDEPETPKVLGCGFSVHAHEPGCYDIEGKPICGKADYVIHFHEGRCFNENGELVCTLPEVLQHIHSDNCYVLTDVWSCGHSDDDLTAHIHGDGCYEIQQTLICELAEDEEHTHADVCYSEAEVLVCDLPETETHIHDETCTIVQEKTLICGMEERFEHIHTPECYDSVTNALVCGCLETFSHQHGDECMTDDVIGGSRDFIKPLFLCNTPVHQHTLFCYNEIGEPACGYADYVIHIHDRMCYDESGALICPLDEVMPHTHGELCYAISDVRSCGCNEGDLVTVHIHDDNCYTSSLVCVIEGDENHSHTDECYVKELSCTLNETEVHIHNESCEPISDRALICLLPEIIPHIHTELCYGENGERICGMIETLEHQHSESCRSVSVTAQLDSIKGFDPAVDVITPVIGAEEINGFGGASVNALMPELDMNAVGGEALGFNAVGDTAENLDETEITEPVEISAEPEVAVSSKEENVDAAAAHIHTDECYEINYGCGFEEHIHNILCYADINADRDVAEEYRMRAESVELSGEYGEDVVSIARSQIGYTESKQNFILDQNGVRKGYNLYSDWYTGGDGAYTDWNATFAAFCLEKAGIDREELLFNSGVHAWTVDLEKEWLLIRDTENAKFGAGDIVFFDTNGDGRADRVGVCITQRDDDGIFYTIEGDTPVTGQVVFEENNGLTALGFDGIAAFADFDAETETVFDEREITNAERSYVWDDDNIESHAVAEVMHSYSDGDIVGYVKLSVESEVETYADYSNNYSELYTGDFTDLNEAIDGTVRDFVIVNTTNNEALALEERYELNGKQLEAKSAFQLQGTKWYFGDVWDEHFCIYTKDESGQKYFLVVSPSGSGDISQKDLFLQPANDANGASNNGARNPNFKLEIGDGGNFKIKCAYPDGSAYLKFDGSSVILGAQAEATLFSLYDDNGNVKVVDSTYLNKATQGSSLLNDCNNGASFYIAPTYNANNPLSMTATADGRGLQANWLSTDKNNLDTGELAYWHLECVKSTDDNNPRYRLYADRNGTRYYVYLGADSPVLYEYKGDHGTNREIVRPSQLLSQGYSLSHYWFEQGFRTLLWENNSLTTRVFVYGSVPNNVKFYDANGNEVNPTFANEDNAHYGPYAIRVGSETNPNEDNAFLAVDEVIAVTSKPFTPGVTEVTPDMIWIFDAITGSDYTDKDYRIRTGDNSYLSLFGGTEGAEISITTDPISSKFRLHNDENGVTAIESLTVAGKQFAPREFIALENGKFVYKSYGENSNGATPRGQTGGYKLYYKPEIVFDHIYQISTFDAPPKNPNTPVDIVLREGEVVRLDALSYGYQNGNITIVSVPDGTDITATQNTVDCSYYQYEQTSDPMNPHHSEYILEALHTGKVQIQIKSDDGYATIYVNVTVVPNDDNDAGYYEAIKDTFQGYYYGKTTEKSKRYHHLDVEVEANFDINVYRPDGSVHKIEPDPGSIEVTKVYATVYNTASLLTGDAKATWHGSYLHDTGKDSAMAPYVNKGVCENFINPVPKRESYDREWGWFDENGTCNYHNFNWLWKDKEKTDSNPMYMTNGVFDDNKIFKDYEFIDVETVHYSNECFPDGGEVLSYTVEYNPGKVQGNGQYEFLTNGWGWLELYDGDTAILHCTVKYDYNGTTYTVEKDVTRIICDTTNICPSGYSNDHPIQGFDIDVFFDDVDEFESTEFTKVDQYGDPISGARFAFYRDTGASYDISGKTPLLIEETDEDGVFHFTYNDVVNAGKDGKLTHDEVTRIIGEHRPGDAEYNNAPLTMAQLCKFLGKNFVMVETKIPDGYHKVGDQINMCFLGDTNVSSDVVQSSGNLFLVCDNTIDSGVYTDPNAFIEAPEGGRLARADNNGTIPYVNNDSNHSANGRLFAVVAKRNGVNPGANDYRYMNYDHWDIVYGNDYEGYFYAGEGNYTDARIGVAKLLEMRASGELAENEGIYEFAQDQFDKDGRYTVSARNLPGDIKRYVNYIVENNNNLTQADLDNLEYAILYYYLPNGMAATADNLIRVTNISNGTGENTKFDVNWSSTVKIPNIENRLFFQKRDSDGNLLNDAGFALYHSGDPEEGERNIVVNALNDDAEYANANIFTDAYYTDRQGGNVHYYLGDITEFKQKTDDDTAWSAVGKAIIVKDGVPRKGEFRLDYSFWSDNMERGYVTKPNAGRIQFVDESGNNIGSISPATKPDIDGVRRPYVGYTHGGSTENGELTDECSVVAEAGTGHFGRISNGKYILREIKPPSGFNVNNNAQTLVLVNDSGVFANAGKPYDSVSVANGAGYLVATLNSFASRGTIDESLRWIYTAMRVNDGTTFSSFTDVPEGTTVPQGKKLEEIAPYKWLYAVPYDEPYDGDAYVAPSGNKIPRNGWAKEGVTTDSLSKALVTYLEYQTEYIDKDDNPNKDEIELEAPKSLFDYETNNHPAKVDFDAFFGEYLAAALKKGKYPALEFGAGQKIEYDYIDENNQKQHAIYTFTENKILHGFEARKGFNGDVNTLEGSKTLRLLTDSGWSSLSVYQDFQWAQAYYAKQADADKNTSYRILTSTAGPRELTHLYSNSTFVVVVDNVSLYLNVIKRGDTNGSGVIENSDSYLNDAEFVLYYEENAPDSDEVVRQYYTYDEATKAVGVVEYVDGYTENDTLYPKAYRFTTNEKGAMQIRFAREGTYYLEEVHAPDPYGLIDTLRIDVILSGDQNELATITITDPDDHNNVHYTAQLVTNNNAYKEYYVEGATPAQYAIEILDPKNYRLEIEKIDKNGNKPLEGAQFRVYKLEDGQKVYYHEYTVKGITTTEDVEKAQIFTTALDEDGSRAYIPIHGLANEEVVYYIEEVKPPNGYSNLPGTIMVDFTKRTGDDKLPTVTLDGKTSDYIVEVTAIRGDVDDDGDGTVDTNVIVGYKFKVANESGFALPKTGSSSELIYTLFGMTLMILPIVYIYVRRRRERRAAK